MRLFNKYIAGIASCIMISSGLVACSGGGVCNTSPTPGVLSLAIAAPSQYPAGLPTPLVVPITMMNTSTVDATNLVYTVPTATNHTQVEITANPSGVSGNNCTNIPAGSSCNMTVTVAANASPGSFTVVATPTVSSVGAKINQVATSSSSIQVTANLGLVDIPATSDKYYILPSQQTVTVSDTESTIVYISVLIKDSEIGLNAMSFVDDNGNPLVFEPMSNPTFTQNSVNSYKISIPAGVSVQNIKAQTNLCAECSNMATVNLASRDAGILVMQPSYFNMNESRTTQVITLLNTGLGNVNNLALSSLASPFEITNNSCANITQLLPNQSCTLTINYIDVGNGMQDLTATYNNGSTNQSTVAKIAYAASYFEWSTNSINYFVLGESSITLTSHGMPDGTKVTLSTDNGNTLALVATPNDGNLDVCDFTQGDVCTITISQGDSDIVYTLSGTADNQISVPSVNISLSPLFSYIADYGNGTAGNGAVWRCLITSNSGHIDGSSCMSSTGGVTVPFAPVATAFKQIESTQFIYIADTDYYAGGANLYTCTLDPLTGLLSNDCTITNGGVTFDDPYNLKLYNGRIYVTNWISGGGGSVYLCTINSTSGLIDSCSMSNGGVSSASWNPDSIAFNNGIAYVADYIGKTIYSCDVDTVTGELANCSNTMNSSYALLGSGPTGITFGFDHVYISNWSSSTLDICELDNNALVNCVNGYTIVGSGPEQLNIQGNILYVGDGYNSAVWACTLDVATGAIDSCSATPEIDAPIWYPAQVDFNPFQGGI